jgi:MFS family permease
MGAARIGRQRVCTAGVVIFTAGPLLCGLAWSPAALLAAREVQWAGAAIMTPTTHAACGGDS